VERARAAHDGAARDWLVARVALAVATAKEGSKLGTAIHQACWHNESSLQKPDGLSIEDGRAPILDLCQHAEVVSRFLCLCPLVPCFSLKKFVWAPSGKARNDWGSFLGPCGFYSPRSCRSTSLDIEVPRLVGVALLSLHC
jgi:hypothetical protein